MKPILLLSAAIVAACGSAPALATKIDLIVNGSFEGRGPHGADEFIPGWTAQGFGLVLEAPGTAEDPNSIVAVNSADATSPDGGYFIASDTVAGDAAPLSQTISGLTAGQTYDLTFYQAFGQALGDGSLASGQWAVTFGTETLLSTLHTVRNGGYFPWQQEKMTFVASADTQTVTFVAQQGSTPGAAIAFLDGIHLTAAVPEPASWIMMIVGFGAVGGAMRSRRKRALAV